MRALDFYSLPRPQQDRLVDSLVGRGVPEPVLLRPGPNRRHLLGLLISALAAGAWLALFLIGLGDLSSALALHPIPATAAHVGLAAVAVGGVLHVLAWRARVGALPFAPGIYLFPANVVDAREPRLVVHALGEVTAVAPGSGASVRLELPRGTIELPVSDPARVPEAVARVDGLRQRAASALTDAERFEQDPLEAPTMLSPLAPTVPLARDAAVWEARPRVVAAALGLLLGAGVFVLRNRLSDDRMLAYVTAKNDVATYERYLERGQRHREQIARVALPRAQLSAAIAEGTVDAIDAFREKSPHQEILQEVEHARRVALVREFEQVRAAQTFDALLGYAEKYPDHGIGKPWDDARAQLYESALARVARSIPGDAESVRSFAERLTRYSEKVGTRREGAGYRGPAAHVRLVREPSTTLSRADGAIRQNPMFNGTTAYVTRYFGPERLEPRENELSATLARRLSAVFPRELLTFESGPTLTPEAASALELEAPTLLVHYRVEWSGGAFANRNPRAVLVGLLVFFRTSFVVPGDDQPLTTKFTAAENVARSVLEGYEGKPADGALETQVYGDMTQRAFKQLETRYLQRWVADEKGGPP